MITGAIVDSPLGAGVLVPNPLSTAGTTTTNIEIATPAAMTYAGGTIIELGIGTVVVDAGSQLGTGAVTINSGGMLQLNTAAGIAGGATVTNSGTFVMNISTATVDVQNFAVGGTGAYQKNGADLVAFTTAAGLDGHHDDQQRSLAISNMSQFTIGNLNIAGGVLVLDNTSWASFTAERRLRDWSRISGRSAPAPWIHRGLGGGANRHAGDQRKRSDAVQPRLRPWVLGSFIGLALHRHAGVNISETIALSSVATTRTWAVQGGNAEDTANWTVGSVVNEISGYITGRRRREHAGHQGLRRQRGRHWRHAAPLERRQRFHGQRGDRRQRRGAGIVATDDHVFGNAINSVTVVDSTGGPNALLAFETVRHGKNLRPAHHYQPERSEWHPGRVRVLRRPAHIHWHRDHRRHRHRHGRPDPEQFGHDPRDDDDRGDHHQQPHAGDHPGQGRPRATGAAEHHLRRFRRGPGDMGVI